MGKMTKVVRLQVVKPLSITWDQFGRILRHLQQETRFALNKTIQLCWEYQGFSASYKAAYGEYPSKKEILGYTSEHGYCYDRLKMECPKMNKGNFSQTVKRAADKWKTDQKEILKGERSIPNFKKEVPLDLVKDSMKQLCKQDEGYVVSLSLLSDPYRKELQLPIGSVPVVLKAGDHAKRTILNRLIDGQYKIAASQLLYRNKKWFLNLSYSFEAEEKTLDPHAVMGIDLGITNAAYVAFHDSLQRYCITGGEISHFRKHMERRKRELLKQGKNCGEGRIGHGIQARIKPIDVINTRIAQFRDTCNHKYSRDLVQYAWKHRCSTIQMEDLSGINQQSTFLKNWSYYDLQQKIMYKAQEHGIQVVLIDPKYTSQRCNRCGHIDKESRENQANFHCTACNLQVHADYNAAKNIATRGIEAIIQKTLEGKREAAVLKQVNQKRNVKSRTVEQSIPNEGCVQQTQQLELPL